MRIIGGEFRGRALASVGKGDDAGRLRPTSDRVRESLFNIVEHSKNINLNGAIVLDLFAGTGALGFEALSRGAAAVTFVEKGRVAQSLIRKNAGFLKCEDRIRLIGRDATKLPDAPATVSNICFLDPPYGKELGERALSAAKAGGWLAPGCLVVLEEGRRVQLPAGFECHEVREYGDTHIHIGNLV